jgi:hypothetical protein
LGIKLSKKKRESRREIIIIFANMFRVLTITAIAFLFAACSSSITEAEDNGVSFLNIEDGATLSSPFLLEMGVVGMEVEPKGAPREGYGHHHLLVNDDFAPEGTVIVADPRHIHYGGGQTNDTVSLDPGTYKLTLQFADGMHVSYGKSWAKSITVTVE